MERIEEDLAAARLWSHPPFAEPIERTSVGGIHRGMSVAPSVAGRVAAVRSA